MRRCVELMVLLAVCACRKHSADDSKPPPASAPSNAAPNTYPPNPYLQPVMPYGAASYPMQPQPTGSYPMQYQLVPVGVMSPPQMYLGQPGTQQLSQDPTPTPSSSPAPPIPTPSTESRRRSSRSESTRFVQVIICTFGKKIAQRSQHAADDAHDLQRDLQRFITHLEHRGMQNAYVDTSDLFRTAPDDASPPAEDFTSLLQRDFEDSTTGFESFVALDAESARPHSRSRVTDDNRRRRSNRSGARNAAKFKAAPPPSDDESSAEASDEGHSNSPANPPNTTPPGPVVHVEPNLEVDGLETAFSAQVVSFLKAHILPRMDALANMASLVNADAVRMNSEMGEFLSGEADPLND